MATTWKLISATKIDDIESLQIQEVVDGANGEVYSATAIRGNDVKLVLKNMILKDRKTKNKNDDFKRTIDLSNFENYLKE